MRVHDWVMRVDDVLRQHAGAPMDWGVSDCCLFVCDVVQAVTGDDKAKDLRGKYKSPLGAEKVLARLGGLREACNARFGDQIAPGLAQTGDVGLIEVDGGPALVVDVGGYWVGRADVGVAIVDASKVVCAWRCE